MKNKKVSSKINKVALSYVLGMMAFCAVLTGLNYKAGKKKWTMIQAGCTAVNAACAAKLIRDGLKKKRELD